LWNKYEEKDVIVSKKDLPKIHYNFKKKDKKYYPDSYIVSTNTIVEVKSTYTIKSEKLIPKLEACEKLGYNTQVYLYDKGDISILSLKDVREYLKKYHVAF
jgi:hypothetical protein